MRVSSNKGMVNANINNVEVNEMKHFLQVEKPTMVIDDKNNFLLTSRCAILTLFKNHYSPIVLAFISYHNTQIKDA